MRTAALVAITCMTALAFAGCADRGGDGDGTSSSSSTSRSATSTSTSGSATTTSTSSGSNGTGPSNQAPTGTLSASVNGTTATFNLTGSDPDGDTLAWDLDFGDGNRTNGTVLPTQVAHNYTTAGNLTVSYTLTDGQAPVSYNVTITVASGGPTTLFVFSGAQTVPSNPVSSTVIPNVGFAGASACAGFTSGENEVDCVFAEFAESLAGKAFTITSSAGDPDYEFWPQCGYAPAAGPDGIFAVAGSTAAGPEAGTVPAGAACVVIWAKSPPAIPTHTFTVTG
jgi:hypothetical protein